MSALLERAVGHRHGVVPEVQVIPTTRCDLRGVWHIAGDPINKFDLLTIVNDAFGLGSVLRADESFVCDRTLDASRFMNATGYRPPSWAAMVAELAADPTPYDAWALQWTSTAHGRSTASTS